MNVKVGSLRCEYQKNPLGIDILKPRFSWKLQSESRNVMQAAYRIQVAINCPDFGNSIWDSGKVISEQSIHVDYAGEPLKSQTRYYFRVQIWDQVGTRSDWSEPSFWEMGLLTRTEWVANWITPAVDENQGKDNPSPLLRSAFKMTQKVKSARIYASAKGLYELYLNGCRVGNYLFTPGWTSYSKRIQYQTYDITPLLHDGTNVIGAILGNGWYKGYLRLFEEKPDLYGTKLALLLQMHIRYEDGTEKIIISDSNWKAINSPIVRSEIYHGETYQADLEEKGWCLPGYDDSQWWKTTILDWTQTQLIAQEGVPVKIIEEIKPLKLIHTPKGETVIDFGQNMVGWVYFKVSGPKGSKVVLKHAEVLDNEGNFYANNLRNANQTIEYILKGEGEESFEPHFTFQGFRYVKVLEYPGVVSLDNFVGKVIHSLMESTGEFSCSNDLINRLQHNIIWGQKGNFLDVPTDCPQRDERMGWTGDIQVFARTACFNMDCALFLKKWLGDVKADQKNNGAIPIVVPDVNYADGDSPIANSSAAGWGDAAVIIPWTMYICYGDRRILEEHYQTMKAYVEYIYSVSENGLLWNSGPQFGDWLALDSKNGSYKGATPDDLVATAFYAYSTEILAKTASVLKKESDAQKYQELHRQIVQMFQKEFVTQTGRIVSSTQTANVLVLAFNLSAEKNCKRIFEALLNSLKEQNWHLTTGFLGTPFLNFVLSNFGRTDVAYKLLLQTDYPSWIYQVTKGATTIWEHWDSIKEDGSFWSPEMNSFNHYAYGSIGDWLYRVVAGIDTSETKPGYKHIIFKPQPCREIQWVDAELETLYGLTKINWDFRDGLMQMNVTIPPNATATLVLPYAKRNELQEKGVQVLRESWSEKTKEIADQLWIELGSGSYFFSYPFNLAAIPELPDTSKLIDIEQG